MLLPWRRCSICIQWFKLTVIVTCNFTGLKSAEVYTTVQEFWVSKTFNKAAFLWSKILFFFFFAILWNIIKIKIKMVSVFLYFKCNFFLFWQSWYFSSHYSSLQCHMILQKSFYFLKILQWIECLKNAFIWNRFFSCNNINVFLITLAE